MKENMENNIEEVDGAEEVEVQQESGNLYQEIQEMNRYMRKQVFFQRLILLFLVVIVVGAVTAGYYVFNIVSQYEESFNEISKNLENVDVEAFSQSISALEEKVSQLDVDSMNDSIHLLQEKIEDLDVEALNEALESMKNVANSLTEASKSMQTVNNWFKNVFKMDE